MLSPSRFFMAFGPISWPAAVVRLQLFTRDGAMSVDPNHEQGLRELQEQLRQAQRITPDVMADVMTRACLRVHPHHLSAKARVARLIESDAFADATLALLELELPQWKLRRLIYEDGEWHCSLSKHIELPTELEDAAEANHESLPLAILSALVEARRHSLTAGESRPQSVPQVRPMQGYAICCDNFA
jgi:hypothetical protein